VRRQKKKERKKTLLEPLEIGESRVKRWVEGGDNFRAREREKTKSEKKVRRESKNRQVRADH